MKCYLFILFSECLNDSLFVRFTAHEFFISVDNVSKILKNNRKSSVTRLLNDTAKGLKHVYQLSHPSQEDLMYDFFKCSKKPLEASLGKLLSVSIVLFCFFSEIICREVRRIGAFQYRRIYFFNSIFFRLFLLPIVSGSSLLLIAGIAIIRYP